MAYFQAEVPTPAITSSPNFLSLVGIFLVPIAFLALMYLLSEESNKPWMQERSKEDENDDVLDADSQNIKQEYEIKTKDLEVEDIPSIMTTSLEHEAVLKAEAESMEIEALLKTNKDFENRLQKEANRLEAQVNSESSLQLPTTLHNREMKGGDLPKILSRLRNWKIVSFSIIVLSTITIFTYQSYQESPNEINLEMQQEMDKMFLEVR